MAEKLKEIKDFFTLEKRKSDRLPSSVEIFYKVKHPSRWGKILSVGNISGGGARIILPEKIKVGTYLQLKIRIPYAFPITVKAQVIWSRELSEYLPFGRKPNLAYVMGVKFNHMKKRERQLFISFIAENILQVYLSNEGEAPLHNGYN